MTDTPYSRYYIPYPPSPLAGLSGIVIPEAHSEEVNQLEKNRLVRLWTVRAIISDHVPLAGHIDEVLKRKTNHSLILNENPLTIYVHQGGLNAIYFDLRAGEDQKLSYIDVRVETDLPDRAIQLAWEPFGILLDSITRNYSLPLVITRLELLSPESGNVIAYNVILPNAGGLSMGPLGGIHAEPAFIPSDAIWREAINSASPFYRLLCAYRMEDSTNELRRIIRAELKKQGKEAILPPDVNVDQKFSLGCGIDPTEISKLRTAKDLFDHFRHLRNAIAHFLVNTGTAPGNKAHVPISDGGLIRYYSAASSALLHHIQMRLSVLREFHRNAGLSSIRRGTILPTPNNKLAFPVRDPLLAPPPNSASSVRVG